MTPNDQREVRSTSDIAQEVAMTYDTVASSHLEDLVKEVLDAERSLSNRYLEALKQLVNGADMVRRVLIDSGVGQQGIIDWRASIERDIKQAQEALDKSYSTPKE